MICPTNIFFPSLLKRRTKQVSLLIITKVLETNKIEPSILYQHNMAEPPEVKPRLVIHGGAGNIHPDTYPPEKFQAYRKALVDIVRSHLEPNATIANCRLIGYKN
jgi:hypothetical protein